MSKTYKFLALPLVVAVFAMASFAGVASAQTASPRLQIQLATNGLTNPLVASTTGATVARLSLNTTGSSEPVRISSLPFILTTANGANAGTLYNCHVYNEANPGVSLNTLPSASTTPANRLSNGLNTITLDAPLVLAANTITTVALRCDVAGDLVAGGTYTFSMNAANVVATGSVTGLPAIVTVPGGTVVVPPVVVVPTVPGLPTTGADGDAVAMNLLTLFASAFVISSIGFSYLYKKSKNA